MKNFSTLFLIIIFTIIFTGCTPKLMGIAERADIKEINKEVKTIEEKQELLAWSAYYGHVNNVKYLIEDGADVNYYIDDFLYNIYPAIFAAAANNQLNMVKYLVENGADINKQAYHGQTASSVAATFGYLDIVQYLAEQGADPYTGKPNTIFALNDGFGFKNYKHFVPVVLKIQEERKLKEKLKEQAAKLETEKKLKEQEELSKIEEQKNQILSYIKDNNFEALKQYTEKYPLTVNFISQPELRLALTGPKDYKVGDIRKLVLKGTDENIIISLVKRVKVPYKEFTLEEIDYISEMGISPKIISAMIDVTTELYKDKKREQEYKRFLDEQKKIASKISVEASKNNQSQKVDVQGNPIMDKVQDEVIHQGVKLLLDNLF